MRARQSSSSLANLRRRRPGCPINQAQADSELFHARLKELAAQLTGPTICRGLGNILTRYCGSGTQSASEGTKWFYSVSVCHSLPLHRWEELFDDFPIPPKKGCTYSIHISGNTFLEVHIACEIDQPMVEDYFR